MSILKIAILGYLEAFFWGYPWNKSCLKLKSTWEDSLFFLDLSIFRVKKPKKRTSAQKCLSTFDRNYVFSRVLLGYLEKFFKGYAFMQICSKLLIEKMFFYKFFCQTIQCPKKEGGGHNVPPSDVSPTKKHADVTRVK